MPLTNVKITLNTQVLACHAANNYANVIYLQGYVDHEPEIKKDIRGVEYAIFYIVTNPKALDKSKIRVKVESDKVEELKNLQKVEELKHKFVTVQGLLNMIKPFYGPKGGRRYGQVDVFSKYHGLTFQHDYDHEDDSSF